MHEPREGEVHLSLNQESCVFAKHSKIPSIKYFFYEIKHYINNFSDTNTSDNMYT